MGECGLTSVFDLFSVIHVPYEVGVRGVSEVHGYWMVFHVSGVSESFFYGAF
jgi:hypothetical protein